MICHLVGDEVHLSGMMDEIDLTEEDTTETWSAGTELSFTPFKWSGEWGKHQWWNFHCHG
jgi:hypothetical protein